MIGSVSIAGVPTITLQVAQKTYSAVVDTGFNGDLELPETLFQQVNPRFLCRSRCALAGGVIIEEDTYVVDFPFDGVIVEAEATFVSGAELLVGTHLLRQHRLVVDFSAGTVEIARV